MAALAAVVPEAAALADPADGSPPLLTTKAPAFLVEGRGSCLQLWIIVNYCLPLAFVVYLEITHG